MMENKFIFTFRLPQYHRDDRNHFFILHLDFNNTTEMIENNFLLTFRLQQYHRDDGNQFIFTFRI